MVNTIKKMFKSTTGLVFLVTIAIGIIVHIRTGSFFTPYNIMTMLRAASFVIIIGFAQTLVLLTGGIDLSVAKIGSLCSMFLAIFIRRFNMDPFLAVAISCLIGAALGSVNGFFIAHFKMTPFIVTLATMQIFSGILTVVTGGMPITGLPESLSNLASNDIGGIIPNILIIMIIVCIIFTIMLKKTKLGRHIYALGGNRNCAKIVGIPVKRVEIIVYTLSGFLSALAVVLMTCKMSSFQMTIASSWQMDSITAAVLGGTSMTGGIGSLSGTIVGGLLLSVITTCLTILRVPSEAQAIVTGLVVLIAVLIDVLKVNPTLLSKINAHHNSVENK